MDRIVDVRGLTKTYPAPRSVTQVLLGDRPLVRAVEDVDFSIDAGETVGCWVNRAAARPRWAGCC